jgi:hypothetical protein
MSHIPASFSIRVYLVINKFVTAVKVSNFSGHYLRNRSTLDIGVLGYIGTLYHKGHPVYIFNFSKDVVYQLCATQVFKFSTTPISTDCTRNVVPRDVNSKLEIF